MDVWRGAQDEDFASRLLRLREELRLSQVSLAIGAGLDRSAVAKIETRRTEPRHKTAVALARALAKVDANLDQLWLLTGQPGRVGSDVERRGFLRRAAQVAAALPALRMPLAIDLERLTSPPPLDARLLENWEARTANFASARPLEPPSQLLPNLESHLFTLRAQIMGRSGSDQLSRRLLSLAAGTCALAGWVCLMSELRPAARDRLELGLRFAVESGDDDVRALLLMLQADLRSAVHTGGQEGSAIVAIGHLEEAISITSRATPVTLRAPLLLRLAEEHASAGHASRTLQLLDQGAREADNGQTMEHYLRPIWTEWAVASYRLSALQLLGPPHTQTAIELLKTINSPFPSHQPLLLADGAAAHAQQGDLDEAADLVARAVTMANRHGLPLAARRAVGVRRRHLARWVDEPIIRRLDELIASIL